MGDFSSWSLNLGRWRGVQIQLHAFFLLFGVFVLYLSTRDPSEGMVGYGLMSLAILFFSVLLHEIGHCYAAFHVGGSVDQIVIGPLGGLAQPNVPHEPQHELVTALAGPFVNLLICLATAPILLVTGQELLSLLDPLQSADATGGTTGIVFAKLVFRLNWLLLLISLLPAFPFDGGRVFRSILWSALDYRTAVLVVALAAKIVAAGMCVIAWMSRDTANSTVPAWVPLLLFAIFLYFSAKQEAARLEEQDHEEDGFNYDFSQGYTSLEKNFEPRRHHGPGRVRRWWNQRCEARRQRRQSLEQEEERRVDEILARLHETGIDGLCPKDRALLERVSARYRNRQQS